MSQLDEIEVELTAADVDVFVDDDGEPAVAADDGELLAFTGLYGSEILQMKTLQDGLLVYRGDSYPIVLTLTTRSTKLPVDLTGASFLLTVDSLENPTDESTQLMQVPGVVSEPKTAGVVVFTLSDGDTDFEIGQHFCDVQMTNAVGHTRTIAKVKFTLKQDITK